MLSPSSSHGFLRPRPPPLLLRQYIENSYISDATSKLVNINNNTKTKKDFFRQNLFLPNLRFKPVKNGKNQSAGMMQ